MLRDTMHTKLQKIRVLDLSHLLPGELCSTILSDLGCNILRVEPLEAGLGQKLPPIVEGESVYYWSIHRNKKRMALDLKSPEGLDAVRKLVQESDVFLENFRPGVLERLGLSYEQLKPLNPGLVYCSISGYGQKSAWSQRPGHDLNFAAETGIVDLNRTDAGIPALPSVLISDFMSAQYAALAIVSALLERDTTSKGCHLDISMYECALSTMSMLATRLLYTGMHPGDGNFAIPSQMPSYNIYECSDRRYLAVAALEPKFWHTFAGIMGMPELQDKPPQTADPPLRARIAAKVKERPLKEWLEIFEGSHCCVSGVNTLEEALNYPPTIERGIKTHIEHPVLGDVPQLASPITFGDLAGKPQEADTDRAATTIETLRRLGYTAEQIDRFAGSGIIAQPAKAPV